MQRRRYQLRGTTEAKSAHAGEIPDVGGWAAMGRPKGSYNKAKVVKKAGGQTTETWATFGKLTAKVILAAIRHNPTRLARRIPSC